MVWSESVIDFHKIYDKSNIIKIINNQNLDEEFYIYSMKFRHSAERLYNHIQTDPQINKLDTYFFSISYLQRHSIELILKSVYFKYVTDEAERKKFIKETSHNLSEMLRRIEPYIQDIVVKDKGAYLWLVDYFKDLNVIDKESDSFRYPFKITSKKQYNGLKANRIYSIVPIFNKQTHIDLIKFTGKFKIAFTIIDLIYNGNLNRFQDYKNYKPIFIEEGGSYYSQSVVGYGYSIDKYYPYIIAYKNSANYLYQIICKNSSLKDTLFIPMCYLYRNTIELSLKEILVEESELTFQEAMLCINKRGHSILGLWNDIKEEIEERANAPEEDTTIINVEKYINQIHDFDVTSDKFRYPTDKDLNFHFSTSKTLDIDNVNQFFTLLYSFLSSVCSMLSYQNEIIAEMESEDRSYR